MNATHGAMEKGERRHRHHRPHWRGGRRVTKARATEENVVPLYGDVEGFQHFSPGDVREGEEEREWRPTGALSQGKGKPKA